jgi:TPR repeat protein
VAQNSTEASEWFRKAAEQGDVDAQVILGTNYNDGLGVIKDAAEAVKWYRKAAEQGHAGAQSLLGSCYLKGEGVAKDSKMAVEWLRKAAEQGNAEGQAVLGACYELGKGVEQSSTVASMWFRKAAEQGHDGAQLCLGTHYADEQKMANNKVEAVKWYRKAADQGNDSAQFHLGRCYAEGQGVAKDTAVAAKWYQKAAEQGHAEAQGYLGFCLNRGQGVFKDTVEAIKWFRKAAEQGNSYAQTFLGSCYSAGEGVVKNKVESYKWWLIAAANGNDVAKKNVAYSEGRLSPTQQATGQRLAQEWEAKHAKHEAAQVEDKRPPIGSSGEEPKITGTGFMITRNGHLMTNYHVVKDCSKVRVQTGAGILAAEIVRVDAASDLALLKVTGSFDALPVVSSRSIRLGAMVATVGFPNIGLQGFEPKLSKGNISSLAGIQDDVKQFQISVPVQPGNSGGALVDERGNVVGVVTAQLNQEAALASTGTLAQNVNYAVKSSYLLSFLEAIPEVGSGLLEAKTKELKFEAMVDDVKNATVLIIGY